MNNNEQQDASRLSCPVDDFDPAEGSEYEFELPDVPESAIGDEPAAGATEGFYRPYEVDDAAKDPEQRVRELFGHMASYRKMMLAILDCCKDRCPVVGVDESDQVVAARANTPSVFSPGNLCALLERAGGLERVDAEGNGYQDPEPEEVEEDGVLYYEVAKPTEAYWQTTAAGLAVLSDEDPVARMEEFFDEDKAWSFAYANILNLASREGGVTTAAIDEALDAKLNELGAGKRASYFVERMERCGALEWKDGWFATKQGIDGLQELQGAEGGAAPCQR